MYVNGDMWRILGLSLQKMFNNLDGIHIGEYLGMKRYIESIRHAVLHANNHTISE